MQQRDAAMPDVVRLVAVPLKITRFGSIHEPPMSVALVERELKSGTLRPVYLITGEEQYLINNVVHAIRQQALAGDATGLNDDQLTAGEANIDGVLSMARTVPMMHRYRVVAVRKVEAWESAPDKMLEKLSNYLNSPAAETVLLLIAAKLDKRRKLYTAAKKQGFLVECEALSRYDLPRYLERAALDRKAPLDPGIADLMIEMVGSNLGQLMDVIERLSLFAGPGNAITEDVVAECLVQLKTKTVWELIHAVGRRDLGKALAALDQVYDPQDRGLRLLGLLAWSTRQLLQFESALKSGKPPPEAAKAAGAPPFKARELAEQVRLIPRQTLEAWVDQLARLDLNLKGGSRRPPQAILESAVIELCRAKTPS